MVCAMWVGGGEQVRLGGWAAGMPLSQTTPTGFRYTGQGFSVKYAENPVCDGGVGVARSRLVL